MTTNSNHKDIENIIFLLNKIKLTYEESTDYEIHPGGAKYLLGQTLRQFILPKSKWYLSYQADFLFKKIRKKSNDKIFNYEWQKRVVHDNDTPLEILSYKGASKTPTKRILHKGDYFNFRQVFHDDHIIPMKLITNELTELEEPNYANVMNILEKISICRMLKSEDRRIKERSSRPFSEQEVIEKLYLSYGIYIKGYGYPHFKHLEDNVFEESIHLRIPKEIIIEYLPHPEPYGDSLVKLPNGMITDIYTDESNNVFTITNDNDLIRYVMKLQKIVSHNYDTSV